MHGLDKAPKLILCAQCNHRDKIINYRGPVSADTMAVYLSPDLGKAHSLVPFADKMPHVIKPFISHCSNNSKALYLSLDRRFF